jgi:hypothetical protein
MLETVDPSQEPESYVGGDVTVSLELNMTSLSFGRPLFLGTASTQLSAFPVLTHLEQGRFSSHAICAALQWTHATVTLNLFLPDALEFLGISSGFCV